MERVYLGRSSPHHCRAVRQPDQRRVCPGPLATALAALIWMTQEAGRVGIRRVWRFWVLTPLFGLGGTLPLFFYFRERRLAARQA